MIRTELERIIAIAKGEQPATISEQLAAIRWLAERAKVN